MNSAFPGTYPNACPKCGGDLVRVKRRLIDRVISLFGPVHRCACTQCRWRGRLPATGVDRYSTLR
ncbi:MAG: hypothetical protein ABI920_19715, partial [Casimicrobiaceae bacterium]